MDRFRVEALSLVWSERSPLLWICSILDFFTSFFLTVVALPPDGLSKQLQPQKAAELT